MADFRDDIEKYLNGQLSPAEMHALERRALEDPFLADALEGAQGLSPQELNRDVGDIRNRLARRTGGPATEKDSSKRRYLYYAVAASCLLVIGVTAVIWVSSEATKEAITYNRESVQNNPTTDDTLSMVTEDPAVENDGAEEPAAKVNPPAATPGAEDQPATPSAAAPEINTVRPEAANEQEVDQEQTRQRESAPSGDVAATIIPAPDTASPAGANPDTFSREQPLPIDRAGDDGARKAVASAPAALTKAKKMSPQLRAYGVVTDADDGSPLPGVNVVTSGGEGTVTDVNGRFELTVGPESNSVVFSFVGLQSKEVALPRGDSTSVQINVAMNQDFSALSEVVVVGYGEQRADASTASNWEVAEPSGGRKAFNSYLEQNMRYPQEALDNAIEGKVTVQFTIEPSGELTDFKVVRGIGFGCDEEVIRLVREGPRWKPASVDDVPVKAKGKVKLKFTMPENKK